MTPKEIESLRAAQERDLKAITEAIAEAEAKIAGIDRNLHREVIKHQTAEIRTAAGEALAQRRNAMLERVGIAESGLRRWNPDAVRRRAKFHEDPATDAMMRASAFATLQRIPTGALIGYLEDAVAAGNVAQAEAIRLEFSSRPAKDVAIARQFDAVYEKLKLPGVEEALTSLNESIGMAEMARVRCGEIQTGHSNPAQRLAAARKMGITQALPQNRDVPEPRPASTATDTFQERVTRFRTEQAARSSGEAA